MFCLACVSFESLAQTNVWTNSASGYWEQPFWSLGILPSTNQDILFTNAWQALAVGTSTVQSASNSLHVQSITLAAPPNSINTLLLNYAGLQNPLLLGVATNTTNGYLGSLRVGSNSTVVILDSALQVNNSSNVTERGAFSIGGTVDQGAFSQVRAGFIHIGDSGPGVYNLTNGSVSISSEYIGSFPNFPASFTGTFNQFGGSNSSYLQIGFASQYSLYDGNFTGTLVIWNGGNFKQYGGSFSADMHLVSGNYLLAGGTFAAAALSVPDKSPPSPQSLGQFSSFLQTGSTNYCSSLELYGTVPSLGNLGSSGSYTLSNGTLWVAGPEAIDPACTFNQSGGIHTNAGISMSGASTAHGPVPCYFNLNSGLLSTPSVTVQSSSFNQSNGTNQVNGNVLVTGGDFYAPSPFYNLSGGLLSDSNATVSSVSGGGLIQSGGTHTVANQLTVSGLPYEADGYVLSGGTLSAPIIQVDSGNSFRHAGGNLANNGLLILGVATWNEQTAGQQFGALQLGARTSISGTNALLLPPGSNCVLQFANSSSLTWSNQLTLNIWNWNGSLNGGGRHRVIFGNNSSALTAQQLSQILFINPAGGLGVFPARILSTGEIVPGRFLMAQPGEGKLVLQWPSGATLQTATNLSGPWHDMSSSTSPYTNFLADPAEFFRLRQ
jgi:hypothetical protein